jgi:uncharacterized protein (TIGR02145 family)
MKKAFTLFTFAFCIFTFQFSKAQNIGIGTNTPHASAALEVSSSNSGFLPPRMTFAQRNSINNPAQGLIIFCTNCGIGGELQYFNGASWLNMIGGTSQIPGSIVYAPSVTIGTQIWNTKNLDVATYRNGDPIPQVTDPTAWANLTTGAWCWYFNDSINYGTEYGRLYNWYAVNDPRGLAPYGWHIPTNSEWDKLTKYLDPTADTSETDAWLGTNIASKLKNTSGWYGNYGLGNGTNSSGFSAIPGGFRGGSGSFYYVGEFGYWWSANEQDLFTGSALYRSLYYNDAYITKSSISKTYGLSVRIVNN